MRPLTKVAIAASIPAAFYYADLPSPANALRTLLTKLALQLDADPFPTSAYFPQPGSQLWTAGDNIIDKNTWINPFPMPLCYGINIEEASIDYLTQLMMQGKLTSRQITKCYLSRINQLNKWTNAVLEINPDALVQASAADLDRWHGRKRSSLQGVPYLLKDNIASADKLETTAGSYALQGSVVPRDAHIVKLLRKSGAILLGKTNMDEWACMRATFRCTGYSGRGGQAYNAYDFSEHPGGSSSGSAHTVAMNMAAFAIGTDTDGSVIIPAGRAFLVGIRPSTGLVSRNGIIPESEHQDTAGPIARSVKDAAIVLSVISGLDARDSYTLDVPSVNLDIDYASHISTSADLRGVKFGLPWRDLWSQTPNRALWPVLLPVLDKLQAAGVILVNHTEFPAASRMLSNDGWTWQAGAYHDSVQYRIDVDFMNNLEQYLSEVKNTNIKKLDDLIAYNNDFTDIEGGCAGTVRGFADGQAGFDNALKTSGQRNATYDRNEEQQRRWSRDEGIDAALQEQSVVALLAPYAGGTPTVSSIAGYPIITIPAGTEPETGIPVGLALIGRRWDEAGLIRYASAIEDLLQARRTPQFYNYWNRNVVTADNLSR